MSGRIVALAMLAALAVHAPARADELPMPGPVIDDQKPKQTDPDVPIGKHSEPLWEFGLGVAAVRFPDYRGSDQNSTYVLPLPFVAYRGSFFRADRDGARAVLLAGSRVVVDISVSASVPSRSKNNDARQGMPNLPGTFEIGPNVNVELWKSADRRYSFDLRMPVREAVTLQASPKPFGATFSPNLAFDMKGVSDKWNIGMLAGPLFADRYYHQRLYGVSSEFAAPGRPAYDASGGYAGWRATAAFSRRLGNAWLGGFVRYDDMRGATFASSPLLRSDHVVTAGFGVSWIFAVSDKRVLVDD